MGNIEEIHFREGEFELSVRVEPQADTVWLNRQQMAQLFDRDSFYHYYVHMPEAI